MAVRQTIQTDVDFIRRVQQAGGESLKKCYQCATCSTVCELSPSKGAFPRKEMLWAQWGQKDRLLSDPDIWLCHQCNDCSTRCPRGARPGDVLAAVRNYIYETFTFPSFMGKAMANPKMLPVLFLIPMIIIALCVMYGLNADGLTLNDYFNPSETTAHAATGGHGSDGQLQMTDFVPAGVTEMLFIGGNILIFAIAGIGLFRFWKQLNHDAVDGAQTGFVPALIKTITNVLTHKYFGQCGQNKPRQTAHLLVMYGFFGAAATAGLALVFGTLPHLLSFLEPIQIPTPIDLPSPIKILGGSSGIAILIGSTMMLVRRNNKSDDVGADGYADRLFLWLVFLVSFTGMTSWGFRAFDLMQVAYVSYYIHMVFVFVLLWYMPYSKFAHMLYRGLAMVWAEQHGRAFGMGSRDAIVLTETKSEEAAA